MRRAFFCLAALSVAWVGLASVQGPAAPVEDVFCREVQAALQAWQYSGVDLPEGYVATITASGKWSVTPKSGLVGPAGATVKTRDPHLVKNGAAHGSLLVRTGDTVVPFSRDEQVLEIKTPGPIYFCVNDTRTTSGENVGKMSWKSLPIKAAAGDKGPGFADNTGTLLVRIMVKKKAD